MASITTSTFDPLQAFVNTRLAQAVPIVDADINELDDIRKFEVRAFLKWFVGDGIPDRNDGFRIDATGLQNDFFIRVGVGPAPGGATHADIALRNVGRCIVDGLDVIIQADLQFTAQPLFATQAGAVGLSQRLGVPVIAAFTNTTPNQAVYLDVWERLVTPAELPSLILPGLGTESCSRMKREWVVRVRDGSAAPVAGNADYVTGHSYYLLATLLRGTGQVINAGDVTDAREQHLMVIPDTIIQDTLGVSTADYRRGLHRPAISLRDVLNSLYRGKVPGSFQQPVAAGPLNTTDIAGRAFFQDTLNHMVAVWTSNRVAGLNQVFATSLDLANRSAGFATPQQVTSGATVHQASHAVVLPNNDLLVAYQSGAVVNSDITMKRAPLAGLTASAEIPVAATAGVPETAPFVVRTGNTATIFYRNGTTQRWMYRRRQINPDQWIDNAPAVVTPVAALSDEFHAAADAQGRVWIAFQTTITSIVVFRWDPATGLPTTTPVPTYLTSGTASDDHPAVLCHSSGDVYVYWDAATAIYVQRFHNNAWEPMKLITNVTNARSYALEDSFHDIWLFQQGYGRIGLYHLGTDGATLTTGFDLSPATSADRNPFALATADGAFWIFWESNRSNPAYDLYYDRIVLTF